LKGFRDSLSSPALAREAIMAAKEILLKKYVVRLSGEERERLETLIRKGKSPAREKPIQQRRKSTSNAHSRFRINSKPNLGNFAPP
jgi:hypothetical protein